jgi:hypothetical protein
MKVFVYFNLHKKLFSLRSEDTKRVIYHTNSVILSDALFKVSQAGRQRVLKEQRKNVHAGVKGDLLAYDVNEFIHDPKNCREATYNPYKYESFVDKLTGKPIDSAEYVFLKDKQIFYWS